MISEQRKVGDVPVIYEQHVKKPQLRNKNKSSSKTDNLGINGPLAFQSFMNTICWSAKDISSLKNFMLRAYALNSSSF